MSFDSPGTKGTRNPVRGIRPIDRFIEPSLFERLIPEVEKGIGSSNGSLRERAKVRVSKEPICGRRLVQFAGQKTPCKDNVSTTWRG